MSEIVHRLTGLTVLVERLVESRKELQRINDELKGSLEVLRRENAGLKKALEEKDNLINILQTAKSLNTKEESEEARKKVDDLVREIEYCLNLLES
jgi:hypothetical protein